MKMKTVDINFFEVGLQYPFKVYFQISSSKMLVLFNENTLIEDQDLKKMTTYIEKGKQILLQKNEYTKYLSTIVSKGNTINQAVAETLAFNALEQQDDLNDESYLDSVVSNTNTIIKEILDQKTGKQNDVLMKILKEMESSENTYMDHANQLFAIASIFLFLMPSPPEVEHLYDLGQGALLHGFALNYMVNPQDKSFLKSFPIDLANLRRKTDTPTMKKIVDLHRFGHNLKSFDDISIYMESFEIMEKASETIKKNLSRGVPKMLKDFKAIQIPRGMGTNTCNNPYVSAKILLIADHVLSAVEVFLRDNPGETSKSIFSESLTGLKKRLAKDKSSAGYDLKLISHFIEKLES